MKTLRRHEPELRSSIWPADALSLLPWPPDHHEGCRCYWASAAKHLGIQLDPNRSYLFRERKISAVWLFSYNVEIELIFCFSIPCTHLIFFNSGFFGAFWVPGLDYMSALSPPAYHHPGHQHPALLLIVHQRGLFEHVGQAFMQKLSQTMS